LLTAKSGCKIGREQHKKTAQFKRRYQEAQRVLSFIFFGWWLYTSPCLLREQIIKKHAKELQGILLFFFGKTEEKLKIKGA